MTLPAVLVNTAAAASKAMAELYRIIKKGGLIYMSFDGLEKDDLSHPHLVLDDGRFEYINGRPEGMIFR